MNKIISHIVVGKSEIKTAERTAKQVQYSTSNDPCGVYLRNIYIYIYKC